MNSDPQLSDEDEKLMRIQRCPTCNSPEPHLHPAMQYGGEVQPCGDAFHRQVTNRNTAKMIADSDAILALTEAHQ